MSIRRNEIRCCCRVVGEVFDERDPYAGWSVAGRLVEQASGRTNGRTDGWMGGRAVDISDDKMDFMGHPVTPRETRHTQSAAEAATTREASRRIQRDYVEKHAVGRADSKFTIA